MIEIYSDGGCIENPGGIGAWAFVVVQDGETVYMEAGSELVTTNNRTELLGVIQGMRWALSKDIGQAVFVTDSDLTVKCGQRLWKRRKNLDLWAEFDQVKRPHYALRWIRGHNGSKWNEMADRLCSEEMSRLRAIRDADVTSEMDEAARQHMRSI